MLGERSLFPVTGPTAPCTQALLTQTTELPLEEGWFGVIAQGCIASQEDRADVRALPAPRGGSEGAQPFNEFSAQLAEGIYGCCAQALAFLACSAPEAIFIPPFFQEPNSTLRTRMIILLMIFSDHPSPRSHFL